ncbi:MAG: hypothetical protein WEC34_07765 [Acidimicrobiia bacterium]
MTRALDAVSGRARLLIAGTLGCLAIATAIIAIAPVHATVVTQHASTLAGEVSDPPPSVVRDDLRVTVTMTSDVPVQLVLPAVGTSPPASSVVHADAGWRVTDDVLVGSTPGSRVTLRAVTRALALELRVASGAGSVRVQSGGSTLDLSLDSSTGPQLASVTSGRREYTASERFSFTDHRFALGGARAAEADTSYALIPVDHTVGAEGRTTIVTVSRGAVLAALAGELADVLPLLVVAALIGLVSLVLGGALLVIVGSRTMTGSFVFRFAFGLAAPVVCLGALHYVMPVSVSVLVTATGAALVVVAAWRRDRAALALPRPSIGTPVALVSIVSVLVTVAPAVLTRRMNIGLLQTDVYDYFHLSRDFWSSSITGANTDWGDGLRVIDSSWRAAIGGVTGLDPAGAALALRFLLAAAVPLAIGEAARSMRASAWKSALAAAVAAFSAPLLALWVEGYLSRELFASLTLIVVAAAVVALARRRRDGGDDPRDARAWAGVGVASALPVAMVPPYSTMIGGICAALLAVATRRSGRARLTTWIRQVAQRAYELWWFAGGLALAGIVNLLWMRNTAVAADYASGVRLIGLNVVVPFYDTGRYPAAVLGLLPFHANREAALGIGLERWVPGPFQRTLSALDHASSSYVWVGLAAIGIVVLLVLATRRGLATDDLRAPTILLGATFALTVVGFVATLPFWADQSFFTLMWGWTLAPLALACGALLLLGPGSTMAAASRLLAVGVVALLALANIGSSAAEASRWLEHPDGAQASRSHFDLAPGLADLRDEVDDVASGATTFRFDLPASDLSGTDDDRVLVNMVELVLRDAGLRCTNCVEDPRNGSVLRVESPSTRRTDLVVIPGGTRCERGQEVRFEAHSFIICHPAGPASE